MVNSCEMQCPLFRFDIPVSYAFVHGHAFVHGLERSASLVNTTANHQQWRRRRHESYETLSAFKQIIRSCHMTDLYTNNIPV